MFEDIVKSQNWSKFRLKQINHAIFQELVSDWSQATSLPKDIREYLQENVPISSLKPIKEQISDKKDTIKILFELTNGQKIESVLMIHEDRNTVCISSQVGCPVGCVFCATGQMGFKRNLTASEIIDQVLFFARYLHSVGADPCVRPSPNPCVRPDSQHVCPTKITNLVFMGMGEPMLNLDSVSEAIKILTDDNLFGLGKRKITVSTSGYVKPLQKFLQEFPHIGLAISLHAPSQTLREKLMPTVAKANPLEKLLAIAKQYSNHTKRRISYEYILIEDLNDDLTHARKLAEILSGHLFHVNLIPYNPAPSSKWKRPNTMRINRFKEELIRLKVPVSVRVSMGKNIAAACGQLSAS